MRRLGDFLDRGVHLEVRGVSIPVPTPSLAQMRCRRCHRAGVTVTAMAPTGRTLFGWCQLEHAQRDGLRLPISVGAGS